MNADSIIMKPRNLMGKACRNMNIHHFDEISCRKQSSMKGIREK
jgi:hypothetical protein